jgi:hypothetical protein
LIFPVKNGLLNQFAIPGMERKMFAKGEEEDSR